MGSLAELDRFTPQESGECGVGGDRGGDVECGVRGGHGWERVCGRGMELLRCRHGGDGLGLGCDSTLYIALSQAQSDERRRHCSIYTSTSNSSLILNSVVAPEMTYAQS